MRRRQLTRARGMTMIEVLVAMAIITMMMVSVWSSFSSTVDGMKATESIQERYAAVRNSVDRMSSEIATAYLSFNRPGGETRHYTLFEGRGSADGDNLTFSSFGHLRIRRDSNESDQTVIQYFLDDDPEDPSRQHLYRRESPRLTGDKPEDLYRYVPAYVLCEDVESLELRYWDAVNLEWIDEWRTTTNDAQPDRLPQRVEIKLGIMNRDTRKVEYFITQTALPMQEKLDFSK